MPTQPHQQPRHPPPRLGSLCTGYGGLDLAVEDVFGARLEWVADPAPGPSKVLAHNLPTVPNIGDLKSIDWPNLPPVDIVAAGFPCQPVSFSGRHRGTNDERWLIHDILDGVRQMPQRPALLILENVRGLLTANQGNAMRAVVQGLAEHGFLARWRVLRASDVGAPHQRARTFIVARDALRVRRGLGTDRDRPSFPQPSGEDLPPGTGDPRPSGRGRPDSALWGRFSPHIRCWEQTLGRPAPFPADIGPRGPRISIPFVEWLMGLPAGWIADVPDLPHTKRREILGNGVVPQQAAAAIEDLMNWPTPERVGP